MRTQSKDSLIAENKTLAHALGLHESYLSHAFKSEVTFIRKGSIKLGICGETRAHGGIVLEAVRTTEGEHDWYVVGIFYWEKYLADVRAYPMRHDDKEAQDRRTCAEQVAQHVAKKQRAFYAPKIAEACGL